MIRKRDAADRQFSLAGDAKTRGIDQFAILRVFIRSRLTILFCHPQQFRIVEFGLLLQFFRKILITELLCQRFPL